MPSSPTTPTRFDAALFAAAKSAGERSHRSAAQQLAHWARLGQELEQASTLSQVDIDRALAGAISYDELGEREQAAVRTGWRESVAEGIGDLDLSAEFAAEGRSRWSTAQADGAVIVTEAR